MVSVSVRASGVGNEDVFSRIAEKTKRAANIDIDVVNTGVSGLRNPQVVTSVQCRRRWTASEEVRMVEETFDNPTPAPPLRRCPQQSSCRAAPIGAIEQLVLSCITKHVDEIARLLGEFFKYTAGQTGNGTNGALLICPETRSLCSQSRSTETVIAHVKES